MESHFEVLEQAGGHLVQKVLLVLHVAVQSHRSYPEMLCQRRHRKTLEAEIVGPDRAFERRRLAVLRLGLEGRAQAGRIELGAQLGVHVVPFAHPGRRQEMLPAEALELPARQVPAVFLQEGPKLEKAIEV